MILKGTQVYYIYIIENLIDGKAYVGQTADPFLRWRKHRKAEMGCPYLHRAIRKYGRENFDFVLVEKCQSLEEAYEREIYWIKELNTLTPCGYNLKEGGLGGGEDSPEAKLRKRCAKLGPKNSFYGKHHSEESKEKIRKAKLGVSVNVSPEDRDRRRRQIVELNKSRIGKKLTAEHRRNLGFAQLGQTHSEQTKQKMSAARKKWWAERKRESS